MSKPWTEHLLPSKVAYMNSIIEQVPTEHGARDSFIDVLQDLADSGACAAGFRYYITDLTRGEIVGTNDEKQAECYAGSEDNFVVDTATGQWIQADLDREEIMESEIIETSDDHSEDDDQEEDK